MRPALLALSPHRRPTTARQALVLLWPYVVIVLFLLAYAAVSVDLLSAARAYVAGESLWSKAQKQATYHLERYAATRDPADYARYRDAIGVPLGDRRARLALQAPQPDLDAAEAGFLAGRNDPADIGGMIRLFRRLQHVAPVDEAIRAWTRGDELIGELAAIGDRLHRAALVPDADIPDADALRERIRAIDRTLTPLEDTFSAELGVASRRVTLLLEGTLVAVAGVLVLLALLRTRRLLAQSRALEDLANASEARFRRAVQGSSDGLWDWDRREDTLYLSPRFPELLDLAPDDLAGKRAAVWSRVHPADRADLKRAVRRHLLRDAPLDAEFRLRTRAEDYRWFRGRAVSERDARGRALRLSGSITDITARKHAEAQLHAEKERVQVTLASIGDAVISTDVDGAVEYVNAVASDLTGWSEADARGRPLNEVCRILDEVTGAPVPDPVLAVLREGTSMTLGARLLLERRRGGRTPIDETAAPIRDRSGTIDGVVIVFRDVSRERQYSATLSYQASHDLLTGLVNRFDFERRLATALEDTPRGPRAPAVLYLDLDQFKLINDTSGHAAGDELLRQVSALLLRNVRDGDVVARLGGDEFGILLQRCAPEHAMQVAHKLREAVAALRFAHGRHIYTIGVSIGLVCLEQGPYTLEDVLRIADATCYQAKEKGRNRVQVYRPDANELAQRHGDVDWVDRLRAALAQGRLKLYRQDIRPLSDALAPSAHFELLLRLRDERGQLVPPMAFLPAAERYGLMPQIDRWVVDHALHRLGEIALPEGSTCMINLSGAAIVDETFLDFVSEQLDASGATPRQVCFEISESTVVANLSRAAEFMQVLRGRGCRFAIDDFGAGMSSFAYVKTLPVDYVKIGGAIVRDMRADAVARALVDAINRVSHVMGKATIAEWVEDEATLAAVRAAGIDHAQGFHIARPRPWEGAELWNHPGVGVVHSGRGASRSN